MRSSKPELQPLRGTGSTPLWLQLKHALRDMITFDLKPGDKIPSELELGDKYDLSRITVRQAISALVDEGFLQKQQGRGTFVLASRLAEPLADPEHFLLSGFDAEDPDHIKVYSVETVPSPDWIQAKLGLRSTEPVHKIRKVLSPDGEPAAFRTSFVPVAIAPRLPQADLSLPLYSSSRPCTGSPPRRRTRSSNSSSRTTFALECSMWRLGIPSSWWNASSFRKPARRWNAPGPIIAPTASA